MRPTHHGRGAAARPVVLATRSPEDGARCKGCARAPPPLPPPEPGRGRRRTHVTGTAPARWGLAPHRLHPPPSQLGGSSLPPQVAASGDGEMAAVGGAVLSERQLSRSGSSHGLSSSSASPCLPELRVSPVGFRRWAAPPASDWDLQLSCQEAKLFKVMHAVSRLCEHCIKACSKPTTILLIALTGYICSAVTIPHTTSRR